MLEHREIPAAWRGHWSYNPLDAYGCMLLSENGEARPGLVAQQIAGVYLASLGDVPRWFAEGSARAIGRADRSQGPPRRALGRRRPRCWRPTDKPEGFLTGEHGPRRQRHAQLQLRRSS